MATTKQINEFIYRIAPIAQAKASGRDKWSLPSVCIAQCCCESAYGTSYKMITANAILGIKVGKSRVHFGTAWRDRAYSTRTKECYDGRTYVNITDMFRAYDCIEDAIEDYYDMLSACSRYKGCLNQTDPKICITAIKNGGYATSPAYVNTIMSIITKYDLTQYDSTVINEGEVMGVRIGHASISEQGTANGIKGDQTLKEVCIRIWYSKPWDYMAIHPDAEVREKHARAIEAACANDNIGYGQGDRNTLNTLAKAVEYDLSKVGKCNCDCSSLQNVAAIASGAPGVTYGSNGWTTATMKAALQKLGYKIIMDSAFLETDAYCVRGAIYVKASGHTVCGLDNGTSYKKTLEMAGIANASNYNININPYMEPITNVKNGTRGEGARWVQWCLWRFGLLEESGIDGVIGPKSETAIKIAQKRLGLIVDGIVGKNTRQTFKIVL